MFSDQRNLSQSMDQFDLWINNFLPIINKSHEEEDGIERVVSHTLADKKLQKRVENCFIVDHEVFDQRILMDVVGRHRDREEQIQGECAHTLMSVFLYHQLARCVDQLLEESDTEKTRRLKMCMPTDRSAHKVLEKVHRPFLSQLED